MRRFVGRRVRMALVSLMSLLIISCQNHGNGDMENKEEVSDQKIVTSQEKSTQPVEVLVAYPWGEEGFHSRFDLIDQKLEDISIKYVDFDGTSASLQEKFASGTTPDIIITWIYDTYTDLDISYPLDELVTKHQFNMDSLAPSLVSSIRNHDPEGKLMGMPDGTAYYALYYNKEIFDLFGVEYPDPSKPLTWDELIDLAKKMTAERDGVKYVGLDMSETIDYPLKEFAVNVTDPVTGEILVSQDAAFKTYFEFLKKYYGIPGILTEDGSLASAFRQNQAAMMPYGNNLLGNDWGDYNQIKKNIELAPLPIWEPQGQGPYLNTTPMVISKYSEHKDEAFRVLAEYLSKENQMRISKAVSGAPAIVDPDVLNVFGADIPEYADKNMKAHFIVPPSSYQTQISRWDSAANLYQAIIDFAKSDKDVITYLREYSGKAAGEVKDAMAVAKKGGQQ